MSTPPPFGFCLDSPNPHGGWNDGGALHPVPVPDFAGIIMREAAQRMPGAPPMRDQTPRGQPPPRQPAPVRPIGLEEFKSRRSAVEMALLHDHFDPSVRLESYQEMAELADHLFEIPAEARKLHWQSFVAMLPVHEAQDLPGAQERRLYGNKARACAAIYRYCPQIHTPSCFPYLQKMGGILNDLKEHRQAGPPLLALLKTCEVAVGGDGNRHRQYLRDVYPHIRKDIDELVDRDLLDEAELRPIRDLAAKVAAPGYGPERTQPAFDH